MIKPFLSRIFIKKVKSQSIFFNLSKHLNSGMAKLTQCYKIIKVIIRSFRISPISVYMMNGYSFFRIAYFAFITVSFQNYISHSPKSSLINRFFLISSNFRSKNGISFISIVIIQTRFSPRFFFPLNVHNSMITQIGGFS